jgi:hypothetical protein
MESWVDRAKALQGMETRSAYETTAGVVDWILWTVPSVEEEVNGFRSSQFYTVVTVI